MLRFWLLFFEYSHRLKFISHSLFATALIPWGIYCDSLALVNLFDL